MLVSNYPNVSINTANPPTEMARRDAVRRDLFVPVTETEKATAEKPMLADERARAAANQANVNLYTASGKETETQQAVEGRGERQQDQQQDSNADRDSEQSDQQDAQRQQANQQEAKQRQAEQQEQRQIDELKSRDQEVKVHEQAHAAVGGRYAGAPSYSYELGPDGKQYAVGGEVQIDVAPIPGDPQATVQKMQQVRAAALAPAEPSSADRRIAAQASQQQIQAQAELVQQTTTVPNEAKTQSADSTSNNIAATDATSVGITGSNPDANTAISYMMSDSTDTNAIVYPQRDTFAATAQMELRRNVIAGFYQRATEPLQRQSIQQA